MSRWFYAPTWSPYYPEVLSPAAQETRDRWVVIDDDSRWGRALVDALDGSGHSVTRVIVASEPGEFEELVQQWSGQDAMPNKIVFALGITDATDLPEQELIERAFFSPLLFAQALGAADALPHIDLTFLVDGLLGPDTTPARKEVSKSLVMGPARVLPHELIEISSQVVDVPLGSPSPADVNAIVTLLRSRASDEVLALRDGALYAQRFEQKNTDLQRKGESHAESDEPYTVVLTGGLGGIALTVAKSFARTRSARCVLLSRSAPIERERWSVYLKEHDASDRNAIRIRALQSIETAGGRASWQQADVADVEQTRASVARGLQEVGAQQVDQIFHAAGVLRDQPMQSKTREQVGAELHPKKLGWQTLETLFLQDDSFGHPESITLFGSTSTFVAPPGQVAYVAANAFLDAVAHSYVGHPGTKVRTLHWGIWRDVGMAVDAAGGVRPAARGQPVPHPWLQRCAESTDGRTVFSAVYDPSQLWVLDHHRLRDGTAVMPGTGSVEIIRAAAVEVLGAAGDDQALCLENVVFMAPLALDKPREMEIRVLRRGAGVRVGIFGRREDRDVDQDDDWIEYARADVRVHEASTPSLDVAALQKQCAEAHAQFAEGEQSLPQDKHLRFGPQWQVIREAYWGERTALAFLRLTESTASDSDVGVHPGLLDMASGFAFSLLSIPGMEDALVVAPFSYGKITAFDALPRECVSYVEVLPASPERDALAATLNVTLATPDGRVVLRAENYVVKGVPAAVLRQLRPGSLEKTPLEEMLPLGIDAEGGGRAALWVSEFGDTSTVVSSVSLHRLLETRRPRKRITMPPAQKATDVPSLDQPRDQVEQQLAEIFQTLLGAPSVGIHDDFFALGGHSLIAVRLFARVKKVWNVDLSIATLFQAPTVAAFAELIRERLGLAFDPHGSSSSSAPSVDSSAWSPLVPIQDGGSRLSIYCVHGAGGNVLNFQPLSRFLPDDVSFFGLQARGVDGRLEPHTTVEEMATEYVGALRAVHPAGRPMVLAGYSGGGVVALEMVQQLRQVGIEIPLLVFFDTFHPHTEARSPDAKGRWLRLREKGLAYISEGVRRKFLRAAREVRWDLEIAYFGMRGTPLPHELRDVQLTRGFFAAAAKYEPKPYEGSTVLFRAEEVADAYAHVGTSLGWDGLLPQLEICPIPGDHDSLVLEPHVQVLGKALRARLKVVDLKMGQVA